MKTAEELRRVSEVLRLQCVDTVTKFVYKHPDLPAQAVMISLGELLIQFSVSQVGKADTLNLLAALQETVHHFGDRLVSQH
ncbi:MAG: hypothetical protein V4695_10805 [Pseudomonadota bacterium]